MLDTYDVNPGAGDIIKDPHKGFPTIYAPFSSLCEAVDGWNRFMGSTGRREDANLVLVGDLVTGYALAVSRGRFEDTPELLHPDYIIVGAIKYPLLREGEEPIVTEVLPSPAYLASKQLRVASFPRSRVIEVK